MSDSQEMNRLRKHQREFSDIIDGIIAGSPVTKIIVNATPGSGKSMIPIIAGRLIPAGLADRLCWICPRASLQDQGERNFLDKRFRKMLGHKLTIRSSTNDLDPCRGTDGFITTFQALGVDREQTVLAEFKKRRYVLIIDEGHHAEAEDGAWMRSVAPLYEEAAYVVFMTGTMMRGDKKRIAFIPYARLTKEVYVPSLHETEDMALVNYSRTDALADKSIIPLSFVLNDGTAQWETVMGKKMESKISTNMTRHAKNALFTALRTEYARELLETAINHWQEYRTYHPSSRLLVVAANIKTTKEYTKFLQGKGLSAVIATSEDDKAALRAIKRFKAGKVDVLVTCQVAYEGLDCPAISHIACLTNIRSEPWIIQMVARAVRIDPQGGPYETQRGYVFAPADQMFSDLTARIEADQNEALARRRKEKARETMDATPHGETVDLFGFKRPGIKPLSSKLLGDNGLDSSAIRNEPVKTQREIEADLRKSIETHIRTYAFQYRYNPKQLNVEIFNHFGKKRADMTVPELTVCLSHVKQAYPVGNGRGTGRPRVPTRAVPYKDEKW